MNYPRLYVNGAFSRIVNPISVSITQNITPLSTATMTLPRGENLPSRSWVELFTPYGSAGMFRVRSPHDAYGYDTTTADLEHMIAEVGDYVVKDEKSEMMAADKAMKDCFKHYKGGKWKLGDVSALGSGEIAYEAKYDRVLDVMLSILEQKADCYLAFNFGTSPWTVSVAKKGTAVSAEGRLARNVTSATVTYDDSELVTRVWYQTYTKKDGKITPKWVSKDANVAKYGVIENTVSTSSDMSTKEINHTVNTYLNEHKEPRVTISIQAEELSQITGEGMDQFTIGKLMRLALPDYGVTVQENITSVTWNDPYNAPMDITIRLGAEEDTVVTYLHNLDSKGSGGGGGGGAKKDEEEKWKEYNTSIYQDDYRIDLNAQRVDRANNILQQAGMSLNSKGVIVYAHDNENNIMSAINTQADRISLVVRGTGKNAKVDAASIVLGINQQTGSYVKIRASTIELDGYATIGALKTERARITNLMSGNTVASTLNATTVSASVLKVAGTRAYWRLANIPGYGYLNYLGQ